MKRILLRASWFKIEWFITREDLISFHQTLHIKQGSDPIGINLSSNYLKITFGVLLGVDHCQNTKKTASFFKKRPSMQL